MVQIDTCEYCETADGLWRESHGEYICTDCVYAMISHYDEPFPEEEIQDVELGRDIEDCVTEDDD